MDQEPAEVKPKKINKSLMIVSLLGGILIVAIIVFLASKDAASPTNPLNQSNASTAKNNQSENSDKQKTVDLKNFTKEEIAQHSTKEDCWTIIEDSVYDLTSFIGRHPGGDQVVRACGTDGTSLFTERRTEDGQSVGSGTPHSSNANAQLSDLKIGDLKQ